MIIATVDCGWDEEEEVEGMWQHVTSWSHSMEVDYVTKKGKNILTKAYFPFDPKVTVMLFQGRFATYLQVL